MRRILFAVATLCALVSFSLLPFTTPTTAGGNVASANGSGHSGSVTLSFGAFDHGEGNYTGQATFIDDSANTKITIDVECLTVSGNTAIVGGVVRKSTDGAFAPGSGVIFSVVDNGEGAGSSPDAFSQPHPGGCGSAAKPPNPVPSDSGNIQVRYVAPDKDCTKCVVGTHCAGNGECVGGGGSGGGGGGITCPTGYRDCCGTCLPEFEACPIVCP